MSKTKIIFILPNIYECINGVSTKYIKFIKFLENNLYSHVIFTTFKNNDIYHELINNNVKNIIKMNGLNVPFYKDIKIPIIDKDKLNNEIVTGDEIIIFNGEFIWIYNILKKLKKKYKNLKLYPTMHTDYIYYNKFFYKNYDITSIFNFLNNNLEDKTFNGIIVTGELMKKKYSEFTNSIFNANEVNLDIFNEIKKDNYQTKFYNFIYCGRISKEKNIEEIFDCCLLLNDSYNFILNMIGDGPYLDNLKNIIDIEYIKIKSKIIFHGSKNADEINNLYHSLENRIFIFTSLSETFGKTPMEAGATGIPIFIKKNDISESLYENKKNAFIFEDKDDFKNLFIYFLNLDSFDKERLIINTVDNIKKYDQNIIFENWIYFLINGNTKKNKNKIEVNMIDFFTFQGISKFINCTGTLLGD